jgi:glycosyltransferase involved in cell wall biosynthesis
VRRSPWAPARQFWILRVRRELGRTRLGHALKRRLRRPVRTLLSLREGTLPPSRALLPRPAGTAESNVVLISHCDFTGNSALHAYCIASELRRRGLSPAVAVPGNAKSVEDVGLPPFPVLTFGEIRKGRLRFPDGRGVDLVHAFTPREHVRRLALELVRAHGCPYVVHLEDNEAAIVAGRSHRLRASEFVASAAGMTAVVDRLLELKPERVPGVVVWPGFDEAVLTPRRSREEVRAQLGLNADHLVLVYPGNVHDTNLAEIRSLYLAVARLRSAGHAAVLVKTGWNFVHRSSLPDLGVGIRDLGWVARAHVPELLAAADILVQPGRSDSFNDFRFPSKLPEFLASGRPVVLPRTNIGLHLEDGVEALLLEQGDADEICEKVALLAEDPVLRASLGERGRAFALRELRWSRNAEAVVGLYDRIRFGLARA